MVDSVWILGIGGFADPEDFGSLDIVVLAAVSRSWEVRRLGLFGDALGISFFRGFSHIDRRKCSKLGGFAGMNLDHFAAKA